MNYGSTNNSGYINFDSWKGTRMAYIGNCPTSATTGDGIGTMEFYAQNGCTGWNFGNGNVGIGNANPSVALDVVGSQRISDSTSVTMEISTTGTSSGTASIQAFLPSNINTKKNIVLNAWGGYVGIGTTNPVYDLDVNGSIRPKGGIISHHPGLPNYYNVLYFGWNGAGKLALRVDVTDHYITITTSDYRIKQNIKPSQNILDRLCSLKMFDYQYKDVGAIKNDGSYHIGFFAHELQELFPEYENIVYGKKDGYQSDNNEMKIQQINSFLFSNILLKAIQEQQQTIDSLQNRLKTLEARLDAAGL